MQGRMARPAPWLFVLCVWLRLSAAAACSGSMGTITASTATAISSGFPLTTSAPATCTWVYRTSTGDPAAFSMYWANFEPLVADSVVVSGQNGDELARYSAFSSPSATVYAPPGDIIVTLYAEAGRRDAACGFNLTFAAPAPPPVVPCTNGSTTYLTVSGATFLTPWVPRLASLMPGIYFPARWSCRFVLDAAPTDSMYLVFKDPAGLNMGPTDTLTVTDVGATQSTIYTIAPVNSGLVSASNGRLVVDFTSGNEPMHRFMGWATQVQVASGRPVLCSGDATPQTALSGVISNTNPALFVYTRYLPNTLCTLPISVAAGNSIILNGSVYTNAFVDTVEIYDGDSTAAPLIASLSGRVPASDLFVSTGPNVVVVFRTGATVELASPTNVTLFGFQLAYQAVAQGSIPPTLPPAPIPLQSCGGVVRLSSFSGTLRLGIPGNTTNGYARNLDCRYEIAIPGDFGLEFTVNASLGAGDQLYQYMGRTADANNLVNVFSNGRRVYYSPSGLAYIRFQSDAQLDPSAWGFLITYTYHTALRSCTRTGNLANSTGDSTASFGYPTPVGAAVYKYLPNMDCTWLIDLGMDLIINAKVFDLGVGDLITIYQGATTSSPVVYSGNTAGVNPAAYPIKSPALIRFQSDSSPVSTNGLGFQFYLTPQRPEVHRDDGFIDYPWRFGGLVRFPESFAIGSTYSGDHDITYSVAGALGFSYSAWGFTKLYLGVGDFIEVYDGLDTSAPLITVIRNNGMTRFNVTSPAHAISCQNFTLRVVTHATTQPGMGRYGFEFVYYGQLYPPLACGMPWLRVWWGNALTANQTAVNNTNLNYDWIHGNLNMGYATGYQTFLHANITGVSGITDLSGAGPTYIFPKLRVTTQLIFSGSYTGMYFPSIEHLDYFICVSISGTGFPSYTLPVNWPSLLSIRAWALGGIDIKTPRLRSADSLPLTVAFGYSVPSSLDALEYVGYIGTNYKTNILPSFALPSLKAVGSMQWVASNFTNPLGLFAPVLRVADQITWNGVAGNLSVPNLSIARNLYVLNTNLTFNGSSIQYIESMNLTNYLGVKVDLSNLQSVGQFLTASCPNLVAISCPVLTVATTLSATTCPLLRPLPLGALQSVGAVVLPIGNNFMSTYDMPRLQYAVSLVIPNTVTLTTVNLVSLLATGTFSTTAISITDLLVPKLQRANTFSISSTQISTLDLSNLTSVSVFSVSGDSLLESVLLPQLVRVDVDFALANSVATTLMSPVAVVGRNLTLTSNSDVSSLYLCELSAVGGTITVSDSSALSCADTRLLFSGQVLVMDDFQCDASSEGVYGCAKNYTRVVNATDCPGFEYTVECIQEAIFKTYSGAGVTVYVPPGTYRDCSTQINFLGRSMQLTGAGVSETIIDCEGVGSAMVFSQGEGADTIISDISFRNGRSSATGGMFSIKAASPTFVGVRFESSVASTSGGAGYIDAGSPEFTRCVFSGNSAGTNGGALTFTRQALASLQDCVFDGNAAGGSGGAVALIGASSGSLIVGANFTNNQAARGAAIYADAAASIAYSVLAGNTATQYGGGVAAVPTQSTGVVVTFDHVSVRGNSAKKGGGLYASSCSLTVTASEITDNIATLAGGAGVYASCSIEYRELAGITGACPNTMALSGVTLSGNAAQGGSGGGVFVQQVIVNINGATLSGNSAAQNGGGVAAVGANLTVHGAQITGNAVGTSGGGVYCEASGRCEVDAASNIGGNYAEQSGGGVFFCSLGCQPTDYAPIALAVASGVAAGNTVGTSGYGAQTATDPTTLSWLTGLRTEVVSGSNPSTEADGALRLLIQDAYGQTAVSGIHVLQLVLTDSQGGEADNVALYGETAVLADAGNVAFLSTTIAAKTVADTNAPLILACRHATVAALVAVAPFTLRPCGAGQGADPLRLASMLVCQDCMAGTFSNASGAVALCEACAAGHYAPSKLADECLPCDTDTFQPTTGAIQCLPCGVGSRAPAGAVECVAEDAAAINAAGVVAAPLLYGGVFGALAAVCCFCVVLGRCLYIRTRRKTLEKYYIDEDATVRRSAQESTLALAVKKMIGATTTTRIGGGEYTDVYKAKHEGEWIVMKVLRGEAISNIFAQSEFQHEVVILSLLGGRQHPSIVDLKFYLEHAPVCIGLEFCPNGSLKRQLALGASFSPAEKVRMAAQIASALAVLHDYEIVHMDIKTDNILMDEDNTPKVADFGISRMLRAPGGSSRRGSVFSNGGVPGGGGGAFGSSLGGSEMETMQVASVGGQSAVEYMSNDPMDGVESYAFTPQYVDPYRLQNEHDVSDITLKRADVFTFGMVMWAIYAQQEPFAGIDPEEVTTQRRADPLMRPPAIVDCHMCYERVMTRAWCPNQHQRPTMQECFAELSECLKSHFGIDLPAGYYHRVEAAPDDSTVHVNGQMPSFASFGSGGFDAASTKSLTIDNTNPIFDASQ